MANERKRSLFEAVNRLAGYDLEIRRDEIATELKRHIRPHSRAA